MGIVALLTLVSLVTVLSALGYGIYQTGQPPEERPDERLSVTPSELGRAYAEMDIQEAKLDSNSSLEQVKEAYLEFCVELCLRAVLLEENMSYIEEKFPYFLALLNRSPDSTKQEVPK